jgi:hypothetical protein
LKIVNYKQLLLSFLENSYSCQSFSELPSKEGAMLLRHDIDFDVELANKLSFVEDELGVKSTYFFMLRSKSYNLLEDDNTKILFSLIDRGHNVSIHFDPTIYENYVSGLNQEIDIFNKIFNVLPECISIHRPNNFFLKHDSLISGIRHTYQSIYQKDIKYFSDSQGSFRYGNPLDSPEFTKRKSIHLLIHPVWWTNSREASSPVMILNHFLEDRINQFKQHMATNCKPYQQEVIINKLNNNEVYDS